MPTTAPAAFSLIVAFESAISLGPSFTFETEIVKFSLMEEPPASVDVTVTATLGSAS